MAEMPNGIGPIIVPRGCVENGCPAPGEIRNPQAVRRLIVANQTTIFNRDRWSCRSSGRDLDVLDSHAVNDTRTVRGVSDQL